MKNYFDKGFESLWKNLPKFLLVHLMVVLIASVFLGLQASNGSVLNIGIEFSGGTEITALIPQDQRDDFKNTISGLIQEEFVIREIIGPEGIWLTAETTSEVGQEQVEKAFNRSSVSLDGLSVRTVGAEVSSSFFAEAIIAILVAFVIMAVVIFIAFRTIIPSLAAISAVIVDVVLTVAIMNLVGIPLTFGSLAALLMLIGYSVDTDVLMSARVIKRREDSVKERFAQSMKTGLTFSIASISAFVVLILVSGSAILDQIASVVVIGLIVDIPATWIQNMWMLRIYAQVKDL